MQVCENFEVPICLFGVRIHVEALCRQELAGEAGGRRGLRTGSGGRNSRGVAERTHLLTNVNV